MIETYAAALPAALLNALLVPVAFVLCRKLLRALAGSARCACSCSAG